MPVSVINDSVHITHLFSIFSIIFLTMGASGLRQTSCPFLSVALQREGRIHVRQVGRMRVRVEASEPRRQHLHDFSLVAGGSWGCHLHILDVLGVNPLQGLQALAAKFIDHGRPWGDNTLG